MRKIGNITMRSNGVTYELQKEFGSQLNWFKEYNLPNFFSPDKRPILVALKDCELPEGNDELEIKLESLVKDLEDVYEELKLIVVDLAVDGIMAQINKNIKENEI